MHIISVNRGRAEPIVGAKAAGVTGIFKRPQEGAVRVTPLGLAGDAIVDTENHGGPGQAVYVFGAPDYAWWAERLGRELAPGTFGENLTVAGLESAGLAVGDRLVAPGVTLEVTAPRIPCVTLAARMGDPAFLKVFRAAERPGVYCRVLREGELRAGDPLRLEPFAGPRVAAVELFREFFEPRDDEAELRLHLSLPLAERDRADKEARLARLLAR